MVEVLRSDAPGGVALLGFSLVGHWAYRLSQRPELGVEKTVTFYAARDGDDSARRAAFLAHFAEADEWESSAGIRVLVVALRPLTPAHPGAATSEGARGADACTMPP